MINKSPAEYYPIESIVGAILGPVEYIQTSIK